MKKLSKRLSFIKWNYDCIQYNLKIFLIPLSIDKNEDFIFNFMNFKLSTRGCVVIRDKIYI